MFVSILVVGNVCLKHLLRLWEHQLALYSANSPTQKNTCAQQQYSTEKNEIKERIPVGCLPSAAIAMCIPACTGGGECIPECTGQGGCVSQHTLGGGGVSAWGVSAQRGVGVCPGRVCPGGGCLPRGVYPSMLWGRHPPHVNRMTDRCKTITLPQLPCVR